MKLADFPIHVPESVNAPVLLLKVFQEEEAPGLSLVSASHGQAQPASGAAQKLDRSLLLIAAVFVEGDWGQRSLLPALATSKQIYHLITCFSHFTCT